VPTPPITGPAGAPQSQARAAVAGADRAITINAAAANHRLIALLQIGERPDYGAGGQTRPQELVSGCLGYPAGMPEIDPEQAAERVRKLIIVGDNRLKQGGVDKFAKARGTFQQALRMAEEAGIGDRFRPFIERRLESIEQLAGES
jgi:hypothetical protein